jgi:hypothetical protein
VQEEDADQDSKYHGSTLIFPDEPCHKAKLKKNQIKNSTESN